MVLIMVSDDNLSRLDLMCGSLWAQLEIHFKAPCYFLLESVMT